jgi:lysine 2,3-aminomutase
VPLQLRSPSDPRLRHISTREQFIYEVEAGFKEAPMSIRLTPYILSRIDWRNALNDPLRKQFIPLRSTLLPNHEQLTLDSLHEEDDSRESCKYIFETLRLTGSSCSWARASLPAQGALLG